MRANYGVKVGIEVLEDGDWMLISSIGFVYEGTTSGFEGRRHDTGGKDERNELGEKERPLGMDACKNVESKPPISGFGRSLADVWLQRRKTDRESSRGFRVRRGGGKRIVVEWPSCGIVVVVRTEVCRKV